VAHDVRFAVKPFSDFLRTGTDADIVAGTESSQAESQ
jgi:hypothetical protein